jgi:hypothetical protein
MAAGAPVGGLLGLPGSRADGMAERTTDRPRPAYGSPAIPEPEAPAGGAVSSSTMMRNLADGARRCDQAARPRPRAGRLPARHIVYVGRGRSSAVPAGPLHVAPADGRWRGRRRAPAAAAVTRPGGGASGPFRAALKTHRSCSPGAGGIHGPPVGTRSLVSGEPA